MTGMTRENEKTSKNAVQRYEHLDGLRGVAAAIVLIWHLMACLWHQECVSAASPESTIGLLANKTPLAVLLNGHAAVVCFFILSGFVLTKRHLQDRIQLPEVVGDIAKRFPRLALTAHPSAVLAAGLMWAGVYRCQEAGELLASPALVAWQTPCTSKQLIKAVFDPLAGLSGEFNPVGWTLAIELWASYAVFCVLLVVGVLPSMQRGVTLLTIAVLTIFASQVQERFFVGYLVFFLIGVAFADKERQLKAVLWESRSRRQRAAIWIPIGALFLVGCSIPHHSAARTESLLPSVCIELMDRLFIGGPSALVAIVGFALVLLVPPVTRPFIARPARYLGRISVGLYLVHVPLIAVVMTRVIIWINAAGWELNSLTKTLVALLTFLASIGFGHLYAITCDRLAISLGRRVGLYVTRQYSSFY